MRIPVFLLAVILLHCDHNLFAQKNVLPNSIADSIVVKRIIRSVNIEGIDKNEKVYSEPNRVLEEIEPLSTTLLELVMHDSIKMYAASDYSITTEYTPSMLKKAIEPVPDTIPIIDSLTGSILMTPLGRHLGYDGTTEFKVLEQWTFNRNIGHTEIEIIAIGPVMDIYDSVYDHFRAKRLMYWVRYNDVKEILRKYEELKPVNNISVAVFDDYFSETKK